MATMIKLATSAVLYTCVATVISQSAVVTYWWTTGALNRHKVRQIVDVLAGVDMIPAALQKAGGPASELTQQVSFEEILQRRAIKSLDLDLREQAVGKGLSDLRTLASNIAEDTRRFDLRKEAFNANLKKLEQGAKDDAITEVRRTIESLRPRQAKDQLIRMLRDNQMQAVVTMIKAMAIDKRKKLLGEFKDGDEPDQLAEILHQILQGVPEIDVIQQAQQGLTAAQPEMR